MKKQNMENKKKKNDSPKVSNDILKPNLKNNLIVWKVKKGNPNIYEGFFCKEKCFEIKRGYLLFSLYVKHKELDKSSLKTSINLSKLQEKANNMLLKNYEFLAKFKTIS